jgi:predicted lipoprotein
MIRSITLSTIVTFLLLLAAAGCQADSPPAAAQPQAPVEAATEAPAEPAIKPPSRSEVLVSATDTLIVPRFREVAQEMSALQVSLNALCNNPSHERLDEARDAWRQARVPWMRSQAMWFGPIMDRRSRSYVDWAPVEPERIERMLENRDSVDAEYLREFLASTQRGLGAVEYVLFEDDDAVLSKLSGPESIRCQYLVALGDLVAEETAGALADWTGDNEDGLSYAEYFNGTADDSLIGKSALNELVRTSVFMSRTITDMRLGKALGVDGVTPDPDALLGGSGDSMIADMRNQVLGMQDVYLGGNADSELGVSALARGLSEETDQRMRAAFEDALQAIDELEEPLRETIQSDPQSALKAHAALKQMQLTLSTDIVSLLDVTVGFADTDGDGG